jgi:MATE family multidrug resistance protein
LVRREIRSTLQLAIPIVFTQLGAIAMGIVDTVMVGWLGADPLSAVALGDALSFTILIVCLGVLTALDAIVSQSFGAGDLDQCRRAVQHGVVLAVALSVPSMLLLSQSRLLFQLLGQSEALVASGSSYVRAINFGVLPFLLYAALRHFMHGIGRARPAMVVIIVANVLNAFANWILIFGNWGAPAMGSTGSAWATTICRWAMFLMLAGYMTTHGELRAFLWAAPGTLRRSLLTRMLRLGGPSGAQLGMEVGTFAGAAMLMGWLGTLELAGHQIAIKLCSTTFMVPLGFSITAAVRVGQALGRRDVDAARRAAATAWGLGAAFMAIAAIAFLVVPEVFVRMFTDDPALVRMAISLLLVGAAFGFPRGVGSGRLVVGLDDRTDSGRCDPDLALPSPGPRAAVARNARTLT